MMYLVKKLIQMYNVRRQQWWLVRNPYKPTIWIFYSTGIYFLIGDLGKLQFGGIDWKIRPG